MGEFPEREKRVENHLTLPPNATCFGSRGLSMAAVRREPPGFSWDDPAGRAGRLAPFRCHVAMAFAVPLPCCDGLRP